MKKEIEVKFDDLEWLYSQNWEYFDYGNCKRHLQVIMPYRRKGLEKKYPVIFYVSGAAWHKQELYNDIPKLPSTSRNAAMITRTIPLISLVVNISSPLTPFLPP